MDAKPETHTLTLRTNGPPQQRVSIFKDGQTIYLSDAQAVTLAQSILIKLAPSTLVRDGR